MSQCEPYRAFEGNEEMANEETWKRIREDASRVLSQSDDAEHLVAVAFLERNEDPKRSYELLEQAAVRAPKNEFVSWSRLKLCEKLDDICNGDRAEIEQMAIANDRGNAAVWAGVAALRLRSGNQAAALEALEEAAAAPYLDSYVFEEMLMYDRALAASTDLPSRDRFNFAWIWAISIPDATTSFGQWCPNLAAASIPWREACLGYHEQLYHRGKGLLQRMIALGVQSKKCTSTAPTMPVCNGWRPS